MNIEIVAWNSVEDDHANKKFPMNKKNDSKTSNTFLIVCMWVYVQVNQFDLFILLGPIPKTLL